MPTCSGCGREIPEGQGRSCSMCYGDIFYGRDGYAREEWERQQEEWERQEHQYEGADDV